MTIQLRGHVPCKKNRWHRGKNGSMYFDEPREHRGNIKALIGALQLQAQAQWKQPTCERVSNIRCTFYVRDGRSDLDGKMTTLLDVLVEAGVLRNDSIARVPRQETEAVLTEGEEFTLVEIAACKLAPIRTDPLPEGRVWCVNGCDAHFLGLPGSGCSACEVACIRGRCHPDCRICHPPTAPSAKRDKTPEEWLAR